ncbi:uncharacterized protein LOC143218620 isoform X2 [Lasioglossum baleicum]|uniref:uncharacterized protein LOC143218620 isoform X2 n=1 Tax=Lasioglossum baleicum TaxID=434251 RepID=UPI003FCD5B26
MKTATDIYSISPCPRINILRGFQDHYQLDFTNVYDIDFFSINNDHQAVWFAAVLDALKLTVYKVDNYDFYSVANYTLTTGRKIIVNCCKYEALLIVQNQDSSVLVLHFTNEYDLGFIQDFEPSNMTDLVVWHGMNQLHLGIASDSNISIYTWFGGYFDLVQVIDHGAKKLTPFYSKEIMCLAATGPTTFIFKYFYRYSKFIVTQILPPSLDVSSFRTEESHFVEQFLCLSTKSSTILYKEIHDRFVTFQQIPYGGFTVPIFSNRAILFLLLHEDSILSYQYNGWRFTDSTINLLGVESVQQVLLHGKELLLVKYKNGTWTVKEPTWLKQKSYKDIQEEIRTWNINAKRTAQRTLTDISVSKNPIRILNGRVDQLFVYNINDHNSLLLRNATKRFQKLISDLKDKTISLDSKLHFNASLVTFYKTQKLRLRCKTKCKMNRLNVKENHLLSKLTKAPDQDQALSFKALRVMEIENWKCPVFSLPIKKIQTDKLVNGILLNDLEKNVLKTVGDQEVSGKHTFVGINVTDAFMTLDVALNVTKQQLRMQQIKTTELRVMGNGFLLPLQGPPTTMVGSVQAARIRMNGSVDLQGAIRGPGTTRLGDVITISEFLNVDHAVTLESAKIEKLRSQDLIDNKTGSVKKTLSNAIPLNGTVPTTLILSNEKMKWSNVTLHGPQNWITFNSQDKVTVSGRKRFLHNFELTSSYDDFKLPVIKAPLCGSIIIVPEIKTTILTIDNITVTDLNSLHVSGNFGDRHLNLITKTDYHHNVIVKNLITTRLNNVNLTEFGGLANSWITSNVLRGPIDATDLVVGSLRFPIQFRIDLPKVIGDMISEKDTDIGVINNINLTNFLTDAIKLESMVSLGNITFGSGFTATNLYTNYLPFDSSQFEENVNLYKKQISGNIKTNVIYLPFSFTSFRGNDSPLNIVAKDSVTFRTEPEIQTINGVKLKELFEQIWLTENATVFQGKYLQIANASMEGNIIQNSLSSILNLETWKNISKRVLSKTKPQEIQVLASMNNVETPGIIGSNLSTIKSSVSDFNDMFDNALMHSNKDQEITAKWTFNKLKITDKLHARNKINNINLKTDVMRLDSKKILVSGKTKVTTLTAESVNALNFKEWAKNSLTKKQKSAIIKGQKNFNAITANNINVSGIVMGHVLTETLSKSADQIINGQIKIQGMIDASMLVINGLVNDVNLTDLISRQLKKWAPVQRIKTDVELQNSLRIFGNLAINQSYGNVKLKNFSKNSSSMELVGERMKNYSKATGTIKAALENRAIYLNKLEVVEEENTVATVNKNITDRREQCQLGNSSQFCIKSTRNRVFERKSPDLVLVKPMVLEENNYTVLIKLDSVLINSYNKAKGLYQRKALHIQNIIDAFVEPLSESLWIALRLTSQTLLLHYQPWRNGDIQEYILPATDVFQMSRSPNDQLLLLLSNGIWNLGLASPHNIINIPLKEEVETFIDGFDYYVQCKSPNDTTLMKAQYIWN